MSVFFDIDDEYEIELTRGSVAAETNIADLKLWHDRLAIRDEELSAMASAFKTGGMEERGLCYKLGNYRIAKKWIERRLTELGVDTHEGTYKERWQAEEINKLNEQNALLREMVENYRAVQGDS